MEEDSIRVACAGELAQSISKRAGVLGTCYHESGHAIVGVVVGRFPVEIWVDAETGRGVVHFMEPSPEDFTPGGGVWGDDVPSDGVRIQSIVAANATEKPMDIEVLRGETEAILYRHWDAVQAIALELFQVSRLKEADIRDALMRVGAAAVGGRTPMTLPEPTRRICSGRGGRVR
jgi:hypothetical protein